MKLYQGYFNIDNIEIIYIKKFPIESELSIIKNISNLKDIFFESLKNEMYFIYKINDKYYNTNSINNLNYYIFTEIYMLNVPNLYIINDKLTNIVNILNINNFEIDNTIICNEKKNFYIFFNENIDIDTKDNSFKILNTFNNINIIDYKNKYDIVIKNNHVNFIGINDNFKIYNKNEDVTLIFLQRIFQILKTISIIYKFYNYNSIILVNKNNNIFEKNINYNNILYENIENITILDILDIFNDIKNKDDIIYI